MLTIVAGVSLLVGGIGVMNIMLVSVAERTREIGLRKAIGASNMHILMQFMFESLILSLLGGLIGFIFGYILSFAISLFLPFPPFFSSQIVLFSLAISTMVGCVFGLLPAIRAASKDPIDSLRYYR
jgi:ABC-type antimicrobial peptide transport system permease subunit